MQRVLQGVAATISALLVNQDGSGVAAVGTITVDITRADGTVVATGRATTAATDVGVYTAALTAVETATLDQLTCVWKDGGTARTTTTVDVAGGYYFSVADARAFDATLEDQGKYSDAQILAARREVEDECERITGVAWVPRYGSATVRGNDTGQLTLPHPELRTLRTITVRQTVFIAVTAPVISTLIVWPSGRLERTDWLPWRGTYSFTYEHGFDSPPSDLRHATLTRLRHVLNRENSGVATNATQLVIQGGTTYSLAQPGRAGFETGIPEVDATYQRYSRKVPGIA